jgi:EpsI family protein
MQTRAPYALDSPALSLTTLMLLVLALYHSTTVSLFQLWQQNTTYSHGILLLGLATLIMARRWRNKGSSLTLSANPIGIALVLSTSLLWLLAHLVHVEVVEQIALIFLLWFLFWAASGFAAARHFAFPILIMLFAVPVWSFFNVYLQYGTGYAVTYVLDLSGIPALLQDVYISVPAGTFKVSVYCTGLRQLMVAAIVGSLYAYLRGWDLRAGAVCVLIATAIASLTNIVRVYIIVMVGQLLSMNHPLVRHHNKLGWVLFGAAMVLFVLLADRYLAPRVGLKLPADTPFKDPYGGNRIARSEPMRAILFVLLGISAGPAIAAYHQQHLSGVAILSLATPSQIGAWKASALRIDEYHPGFRGADAVSERIYEVSPQDRVYVYLAYYARQTQGSEAVNDLNQLYDAKRWKAVSTSPGRGDPAVTETEIHSREGHRTLVIWQWYYVYNKRVSSDVMAKLWNLWGTLNGDPSTTACVIATDAEDSREAAEGRLANFVTDTAGTFERLVSKLREQG